MGEETTAKPLLGLRVLEMAGIGPVPHLGTLLRNLGAEVTVAVRPTPSMADFLQTFYAQGKAHRPFDLKKQGDRSAVLELAQESDVLLEGMRPGVMERLGLGPEECLKANPDLIYARVTGYGQSGPLHADPGHDINYIAQSGALHGFRRGSDMPVPPINLVGDFAGGSMHGAISILAALLGKQAGQPVEQVLDIAMVDGSAALMTMYENFNRVLGDELPSPLTNAPFYAVYESAVPGEFVAVGAIEPQFFSQLLLATGIDFPDDGSQNDPRNWSKLRELLETAFRSKSRSEWARIGHETGSCISAVLSLDESGTDPHMQHRIALQRQRGATGGALHPSLYE
ncbi:CaiB/BaiF CoA transferase family protein [Arthrobacter russicus]|uniref:Alpha-methylacyl-CoA racemase n=1 Tax=Arthrobacter russicus TaxID=172040 RepID=A0ABU1JDJ3_9MICC|nr:CaiB/BaiF CoA-transferase family protein [Arthrobacter russicus]MDN5667234.1 CoA transferase [Renibacterium salmoninarum]MDR6270485.1 alpha-methylacyl-CoA racemase [Arthrobacter russicus]